MKVIHGKPRHPESQCSVERANRDLKNALASKMRDNSNDLCWAKYFRRVQLEKNATYHSTIGMAPFEALCNRKPSFGLSDLGIPSELASQIHNDGDLERVINFINNPPQFETTSSNHLPSDANISSSDFIEDTDLTPLHEVELPFQEPRIWDAYLDDISGFHTGVGMGCTCPPPPPAPSSVPLEKPLTQRSFNLFTIKQRHSKPTKYTKLSNSSK